MFGSCPTGAGIPGQLDAKFGRARRAVGFGVQPDFNPQDRCAGDAESIIVEIMFILAATRTGCAGAGAAVGIHSKYTVVRVSIG